MRILKEIYKKRTEKAQIKINFHELKAQAKNFLRKPKSCEGKIEKLKNESNFFFWKHDDGIL